MIIIFTLTRVMKLVEISGQPPPRMIILELVIANINTGIITGNPNIAIMIDWLFVFEARAEINVNALDKPKDPTSKLRMNKDMSPVAFPRNKEKNAKAIATNAN